MGNTRLGFGEEKMERLLDLCITYLDKFNNKHNMFCEAIGVINNYNQLHLAANYKLNNQLQEKINQVLNQVESSNYTADQLNFTSETYFQHKNASFDLFSKSRHSLRDFKDNGTVELEILEKAVELAQKAPSTCNRQSTRVHIINNKDLIEKTLNLQTGNRGFGDRSSKLIILTSDLQCWESPTLRHGPYFDGGIFTMNLLYALHFYKIGACALNWFATIENDSQLRKFINLPDNEIILVIIGCGEVKEQFKIAKSRRRDIKSIFKVH
ncbi:nitroreductase family protein [Natronoflexus pectinivorans]|nr:nitroreductase family protein [Natronoflexus pectinivorans]